MIHFSKIFQILTVIMVLSFLAGCSQSSQETADLILINGKVVTLEKNQPEAEAIAIKDDKILAVGSTNLIQAFNGEKTKTIDLAGRLAIPGFIDGHAHALNLGYAKMWLDLTTVKSWAALTDMVKAAAEKAAPGEWILGRGWHQEKLGEPAGPIIQGYPSHEMLSAVSPDNPVLLRNANGHSICVNAAAMAAAGITRNTPNPEGGEIIRDGSGKAIGIFLETAASLINDAHKKVEASRSAAEVKAEKIRAIQLAEKECLAKGLTSFQDAGTKFEDIDIFKELAEQGKLNIRFWMMIGDSLDEIRKKGAEYRMIGVGNHFLTVRSIKKYIDGALGSHGAWLLSPYSDQPHTSGLNVLPLSELEETATLAIKYDLQLCTHAIGDRGNREMLNIYQKAFKNAADGKALRWRIEHAQHLDPADLNRFTDMGVLPSMQGVHCTSDGPWVPKRIGESRSAAGAYVWRKLIDSGTTIINGTDAPVEDIDPIANFYATVTRQMANGERFYPNQVMTREEALRSYTINPAYGAFEEAIKGSLAPGKLADITVLSKDILTVPDSEILQTEVLYTIVGGEVKYQK